MASRIPTLHFPTRERGTAPPTVAYPIRDDHARYGLCVRVSPGHSYAARPNDRPFPGGWRVEEWAANADDALTIHASAIPREQAYAMVAELSGVNTEGVAA